MSGPFPVFAAPAADVLNDRGLRHVEVWVTQATEDPSWIAVDAADTEEQFWDGLEE